MNKELSKDKKKKIEAEKKIIKGWEKSLERRYDMLALRALNRNKKDFIGNDETN